MKTFRVGLIGFGFIGKVHAYAHKTIPLFYDNREFGSVITHVCTSRAETAEKAQLQTGAAHAVTDFHEITENPDIDIVDICTPNDRHFEALVSAIAGNKNIYCDKPLTATLSDAEKISELLPRYTGMGQMTFQNRFFPATLHAKQLLADGLIGDILEFRAMFNHSGSTDPNAPYKWKLSGEAGGGVIADLGSHVFDLMTHLLGDFSELSASTHIAYPERPAFGDPSRKMKVTAEDSMQVLARLPNGATGMISASKIATGCEDELSFEIYGTRGALRMNPMDLHHLYYYNNETPSGRFGGLRGWTAIDCGQRYDKPAGFPTPKAPMGWLRGHVHCMYSFLESVYTGKASGPTLADGVRIQRLLEKTRESARCGRWVKV